MTRLFQRGIAQAAETWVPTTLLGISLLANSYFIWQSRMSVPTARRPQVEVGAHLAPVGATSADGQPAKIAWEGDGRSTVVYVLRPDCIWCKRNLENIRAIANARKADYRFVGLSITRDQLDQSLKEMPMPFPVYVADAASIAALKLGSTPQTLVVGPDGRVKNVWTGAYAEPVQKEVETAFHLVLPGLTYAGATEK